MSQRANRRGASRAGDPTDAENDESAEPTDTVQGLDGPTGAESTAKRGAEEHSERYDDGRGGCHTWRLTHWAASRDECFDETTVLDVEPNTDPTPIPDPIVETGEDLCFFDARDDLDPHELSYFDPSNNFEDIGCVEHAFYPSIDYNKVIDTTNVDSYLMQLDYAELRGEKEKMRGGEREV
jgi:hypothetical protein